MKPFFYALIMIGGSGFLFVSSRFSRMFAASLSASSIQCKYLFVVSISPCPMESGSREIFSMEAYLTAVNPLTPDYGVQKMEGAKFGELLRKANDSKSFHRFCCDLDKKTMSEYLKMDGETDENFIALGKKYFDNLQKYGAVTWYDFCVENWGSKWNAINTELIDESTLGFETAWSRVMLIMSKLAEMFPEIDFKYSWTDEDIGNNVGECEFNTIP